MTRRRVLCGLLLASAVLACCAGWLWIANARTMTRARFEQVKEGKSRASPWRIAGRVSALSSGGRLTPRLRSWTLGIQQEADQMAFTQTTIAALFGLIENSLAENKKVEVKALGCTWHTAWLGTGRLQASNGPYRFEGVPDEIARDLKLQAAPVIEVGIELPQATPADEAAKNVKRWRSLFPGAEITKLDSCRFMVKLNG
jgi:hypothetical protein